MTGRAMHPGQKKDRPRGVQSRHPRVQTRATKGAGALVCSDCGVVEHKGKWYWGAPPLTELRSGRCPACKRIHDRQPAGILRLKGVLFDQREEVLRLAHNLEEAEKAEHPMERLMEARVSDGCLVITTTGIHLARKIAHRVARRFHRKPRIRYADDESLVQVDWP